MKFFLDVGHGGKDDGASGKRSKEKDNVLKVAKRLKILLEQAGHTVKMSRSTDVYLTLSERARLSNTWKADYFISLHNNAATSDASGFETFIYNGSVSSKSAKFQASIHNAVLKELGIRDRGMKKGNLAVLRETNAPAVLIEYGFISNPSDEEMLLNKVEEMAVSTAQGIINYIGGKLTITSSNTTQKGDEDELKFSSPTLQKETDFSIGSKAHREIIVNAAVKAGAHNSWLDKLKNNQITDGDIFGLAVKYIVDANK